MRLTGWGTRTMRPVSSVTSRKSADVEESVEALCAYDGIAQDNRAAIEAAMAVRRRMRENSFKDISQRVSGCQQKSPTRHLGASGHALSREEHGLCGMGGWPGLRLFQPITVAGPRPIHTAFPASLACKLKFECMPRPPECQCTIQNGTIQNGTTENGVTEKTA
jgi:hypothetical protein